MAYAITAVGFIEVGYWDMRILPMGERACLLVELERKAHEVARAVEALAPPGLEEVVASFETVGVYFDPNRFELRLLDHPLPPAPETQRSSTEHTVPVCYSRGEDLDEVARRLDLTTADVVRLHSEALYECFAVGFCPGFPYLGPLPEDLRGLPRRSDPRVRVEPGSIGITGNQTGIYTLERPGGWWLIGQTPFQLVDLAAEYFPIAVGDHVRFEPIGEAVYERLEGGRL